MRVNIFFKIKAKRPFIIGKKKKICSAELHISGLMFVDELIFDSLDGRNSDVLEFGDVPYGVAFLQEHYHLLVLLTHGLLRFD